jgi:hypothetical protein
VSPLKELIESFAYGVVEPTPMFELLARKSELVAVMVFVFEKYGNCPVEPEYKLDVAIERLEVPRVISVPERPRPKVADEVAVVFKVPALP